MQKIDTSKLHALELAFEGPVYQEAKSYLENFAWCTKIREAWADDEYTIDTKLGIFLFHIEPARDDVDSFIWIVAGDLPSVYLDQSVRTAREALEVYCELMHDWAAAVISGDSLEECYPVDVEPTPEHATMLDTRIRFIEQELLP